MRHIKLTNTDAHITIDDEDYDKVKNTKWSKVTERGGIRGNVTGIGPIMLSHFLMNDYIHEYDHKDTNYLNNQKYNLRICTSSQNAGNRNKAKNGSKSKYKGVCWDEERQKWMCWCGPKQIGRFDTEIQAAKAYNIAAVMRWGEFARVNIIYGTTKEKSE